MLSPGFLEHPPCYTLTYVGSVGCHHFLSKQNKQIYNIYHLNIRRGMQLV